MRVCKGIQDALRKISDDMVYKQRQPKPAPLDNRPDLIASASSRMLTMMREGAAAAHGSGVDMDADAFAPIAGSGSLAADYFIAYMHRYVTVCPQLFALNCLPSTVCPQLFALNSSLAADYCFIAANMHRPNKDHPTGDAAKLAPLPFAPQKWEECMSQALSARSIPTSIRRELMQRQEVRDRGQPVPLYPYLIYSM
jgi:hypothetical protein